MSAFVLNHKHINTLLSWANRNEVSKVHLADGSLIDWHQVEDLQRAAEILLAENIDGVATVYADSPAPLQGLAGEPAITFHFEPCELAPVAIIKATECYDYQACAGAGYQDSDAARIVAFIRSKAIKDLPGYKQADWEIA